MFEGVVYQKGQKIDQTDKNYKGLVAHGVVNPRGEVVKKTVDQEVSETATTTDQPTEPTEEEVALPETKQEKKAHKKSV